MRHPEAGIIQFIVQIKSSTARVNYEPTASKVYWLVPCNESLALVTNYNLSHCEDKVKNCTSATLQANGNNSLSLSCVLSNGALAYACNKTNLNMTVTSNYRMPINITCGLIRVVDTYGDSSLTLYPPGNNTIILLIVQQCNNSKTPKEDTCKDSH